MRDENLSRPNNLFEYIRNEPLHGPCQCPASHRQNSKIFLTSTALFRNQAKPSKFGALFRRNEKNFETSCLGRNHNRGKSTPAAATFPARCLILVGS